MFKGVINQAIKILLNVLRWALKFYRSLQKKCKSSTILVKSSAITNNNTEIRYAKDKKIPIYSRAEVLADVVSLKKYNYFRVARKNHHNLIDFKDSF